MEHHHSPPDSGRKSAGTTAMATLGVAAGRKGKVRATGRGSSSAAGFIPVGRKSGSPAGLFPVGRGSGATTFLFPINGSNAAASASSSMDASRVVESSPIGGFTNQGSGSFIETTSPPTGFPFPPSSSPAWWGSDGGSPAGSSFQRSEPTWLFLAGAISF